MALDQRSDQKTTFIYLFVVFFFHPNMSCGYSLRLPWICLCSCLSIRPAYCLCMLKKLFLGHNSYTVQNQFMKLHRKLNYIEMMCH